MQKTYKQRVVIGILCIVVLVAVRYSVFAQYLSLEMLKAQRDMLLHAAQTHAVLAVISYIVVYIAVVAVSLPVAAPLSMLGGFIFGALPAAVYVIIAATSGAALTFLLFRYLLGTALQVTYREQLVTFNKNIAAYGSIYLLMIRCIPLFPFFVVNIVASWTKIPLRTFIWTTVIGIIPGTLLYTYAGQQLSTITSVGDIISYRVLIFFLSLVLFGVASLLVKRYRLLERT